MTSFPGIDPKPPHENTHEVHVGPLRWRGAINLKDITERVIAGMVSGTVAGIVAGLIVALL